MRKACFANARKGAYLAYVTAASVKQSSLYRYKPNPYKIPPPPRLAGISRIFSPLNINSKPRLYPIEARF